MLTMAKQHLTTIFRLLLFQSTAHIPANALLTATTAENTTTSVGSIASFRCNSNSTNTIKWQFYNRTSKTPYVLHNGCKLSNECESRCLVSSMTGLPEGYSTLTIKTIQSSDEGTYECSDVTGNQQFELFVFESTVGPTTANIFISESTAMHRRPATDGANANVSPPVINDTIGVMAFGVIIGVLASLVFALIAVLVLVIYCRSNAKANNRSFWAAPPGGGSDGEQHRRQSNRNSRMANRFSRMYSLIRKRARLTRDLDDDQQVQEQRYTTDLVYDDIADKRVVPEYDAASCQYVNAPDDVVDAGSNAAGEDTESMHYAEVTL